MTLPVHVAKIHHEGAGSPTDNIGRFAKGGYTVGIGHSLGVWDIFRSPDQDYSTLNLNHVVAGFCFSGNREGQNPVTDVELQNVADAAVELKKRGWLTPYPDVSPHDNLAGSATVCPGSSVYNVWDRVVDAVLTQVGPPLPIPEKDMLATPVPGAHPQAHGPFAGRVPFVQVILQPNGTTDVCGMNGAKITNLSGGPAFGMWVCHLGKLNAPIGSLEPLDGNSVIGMASDLGTFVFDVAAIYD